MGSMLYKLRDVYEQWGLTYSRILMLGLDSAGLVYVVYSSDHERMEEAREELFGILNHCGMRGKPVVVLANKQDLPNAMHVSKVHDQLQLHKLTGHKWHVQGTCATTGEGIYEDLNQLASMVNEFKKEQNKS